MSKSDKTSQKLLDSIRKTKASADTPINASPDVAPVSAPAPVLNAAAEQPPAKQRSAAQGQQPQPSHPPAEEPRRIFSSRRVWPD